MNYRTVVQRARSVESDLSTTFLEAQAGDDGNGLFIADSLG